jgi:hypothetical protein
VDPSGFLVFYDEIYLATTDVDKLVELALPKMVNPETKEDYKWLFKAADYENRVAMEDMRRRGILVTNAVKHNKLASVHRLSSYIHPNQKRQFPPWHPKVGSYGAPLMFITRRCKNLAMELPQQRWKADNANASLKDEMDRNVKNHATDAALYTVRLLPHASEVKIQKVDPPTVATNKMSQMYWEDVRRAEARKADNTRQPYRIRTMPLDVLR